MVSRRRSHLISWTEHLECDVGQVDLVVGQRLVAGRATVTAPTGGRLIGMARTNNTMPWRLLPHRRWRRKRWTDNDDVAFHRREHNRRDRHDARADLHRGAEPEPRQPRHRALWDAF